MTLRWSKLAACAVICAMVFAAGCGSKKQVELQMERKIVPVDPEITGMVIEPTGELDTRNRGYVVQVEMTGDPGLVAAFDVVGKTRNQPMDEVRSGVYAGSFEIVQGEVGSFQFAGQLKHPPSDATARYESPARIRAIRTEEIGCDEATATTFHDELGPLTVYFAVGQSKLVNDAQALLLTKENLLLDPRYALCDVHIHGHADETGSPNFNLELSRHRAQEVQWYLASLGVDQRRLVVHFFGEKMPVVEGKTPEALARNRRVEVAGVDVH